MEPGPPSPLPLQIQPSPEGSTSVPETDKTAAQPPSASSISLTAADVTNATKPIVMKKTKKKAVVLKPRPEPSSSDSYSSRESCPKSVSRRRGIRLFRGSRNGKALSGQGRPKTDNIGVLALPLGMSIAAVVAQVLKGREEVDNTISVNHLSQICARAVRESLVNVYGDQFDGFVENFEKSFRSTLMTLNLINKYAKDNGGAKENSEIRNYFPEVSTASSTGRSEHSARFSDKECWTEQLLDANTRLGLASNQEQIGESSLLDNRNSQLVLHDTEIEHHMSSVFSSRNSNEVNNKSILSTLEKSVMEQARSNDLRRYKMGLTMKKLQLKERQLALSENANHLERWKLSFGFSKASFKVEKFKTQLEETRYTELLRKCIDSLVAGLLVMLACIGYGTYLYSHKRITEATASCSPTKILEEPKSWFSGLNPMASFNSGLKILTCQFQVLTRMLAGGFMVLAIAYLLLQRSATSNQAMPVTFIVLLLAVGCGFAGKLCIDTLGGSGNYWLIYFEILCCIHLFSNLWTSILFRILHGPLTASEGNKIDPFFPYWMRRCLFYVTTGLLLPVLCGFLPFASLGDWKDHFALLIFNDLQ